jgi:hypothetical protein
MKDLVKVTLNDVVAFSAVAGVVIAGYGLTTWRQQLKGTARFELARRLLLQVYRVRDGLEYVRHPILSATEAGDHDPEVPWEIAAYDNRWKRVRDAMVELDAATLECEVMWGQEIVGLRRELLSQVNKLFFAVEALMRSKKDPAFRESADKQIDILYWTGDDNDFSKELRHIVSKFEDYVKPHLQRKP